MRRAVRETGWLALCLAIAVALSWPLVRVFTTHIAGDPGDPYQTLWGMRWIHDALVSFQNPFFTDRVFYPFGVSLVFQTFDLPSAVAMVPLWGRVPEVAIYNTAVLLALTLTTYGMFRLVRELTGDTLVALITGVIFAAVPYQFAHLQGHLHLLAMGWVPLALVHVLRLLHGRATVRDGITGGIFLALASLATWYNLLFAAVVAAVLLLHALLVDPSAVLSRRSIRAALALAATWAVLTGPLLAAILATRAHEPIAGAHDAATFSADLYSFVFPNAAQSWSDAFGAHFKRWAGNTTENATYVGVTVLALAVLGAVGDAQARPFLVSAVVGAILALGPRLRVDGQQLEVALPWGYLERAVPLLAFTGVPIRFGYVMYLGLVVAASYGLARLHAMGSRIARPLGILAVLVPFALVLVEYRPRALITTDYPVPAPMRDWARDPARWAVLDAWDFYRPMWHATIHGKPMVGGYLTRVPKRLEDWLHRHPVVRAILSGGGNNWLPRTDPRIDFSWGDDAPDDSFDPGEFRVTWSGTLVAPVKGAYELWLAANDQASLALDGRPLMRCGSTRVSGSACETHATVDLSAGPHAVSVAYHQRSGKSEIHLWWRPPGGARAIVPETAFRAAAGGHGLDAEYEQMVPAVSGLGVTQGRQALRDLEIRYVITGERPNQCVQEELALPLVYEGEGVRIYEVPRGLPSS